jgi:hypothetical protein
MRALDRRRAKTIALAAASGAVGAVVCRLALSGSDLDLRRVAPVAGTILGWAAFCFAGFIVWAARAGRDAPRQTSADWTVINAELARDAERLASKAWLVGLAIGLGITGELILLTRSPLWAAAAPFVVAGAWFLSRASAKDVARLAGPPDEGTKRFWKRVRSP